MKRLPGDITSEEEYIQSKIDSVRNAALNNSLTRLLPAVPMVSAESEVPAMRSMMEEYLEQADEYRGMQDPRLSNMFFYPDEDPRNMHPGAERRDYDALLMAKRRLAVLDDLENRQSAINPDYAPGILGNYDWYDHLPFTPVSEHLRNMYMQPVYKEMEDDSLDRADQIQYNLDNGRVYDGGLIEGPSCIYTALDNYGPQYRVSGNKTFASMAPGLGFLKIPVSQVQPGDLVQAINPESGEPAHGMIFNRIDDRGVPRYNYSNGNSDARAIRKDAVYDPIPQNYNDDLYHGYTFVGTPSDSLKWKQEYQSKYQKPGFANGGSLNKEKIYSLAKRISELEDKDEILSKIREYKNGGRGLWNKFTQATIKAAMADRPEIMQAAGWYYDKDGNLVQGDPNEEGASRLRSALSAASAASVAGPAAALAVPSVGAGIAEDVAFLGTQAGKAAATKAAVDMAASLAGGAGVDYASSLIAPYGSFGQNLVWATGNDPDEHPLITAGAEFLNPGYGMGNLVQRGVKGALDAPLALRRSAQSRAVKAAESSPVPAEAPVVAEEMPPFADYNLYPEVTAEEYAAYDMVANPKLYLPKAEGNTNAISTLVETNPAAVVASASIAPYQIADLGGGYMLKSLMRGNPLEKQIGKNGTVNVNNIRALIGKGSKVEQAVVDKVLASEEFTGKKSIDYNQFRKAVQKELITYDRHRASRWEDYGLRRLGFNEGSMEQYGDWQKENGLLRTATYTFESDRIPNGSAKHYDANTLGHSRTYTTTDEPDVLHVMESQSDWAQKGLEPQSYFFNSEGKDITEDIRRSWTATRETPVERMFDYDSRFYTFGDTPEEQAEFDKLVDEYHKVNKRIQASDTPSHDDFRKQTDLKKRLEDIAMWPINEGRRRRNRSRKKAHLRSEIEERIIPPSDQERHLADNFTSRQIQENLRYAAEKGQTKMRYPTRETAAKIEGYPEREAYFDAQGNDVTTEGIPEMWSYGEKQDKELKHLREAIKDLEAEHTEWVQDHEYVRKGLDRDGTVRAISNDLREAKISINSIINENEPKLAEGYTKKTVYDYEDILRKYTEFPKQYQKLYKGAAVRTVTDPKGNTWYEVDVPDNYLKLEWPYKYGGTLLRSYSAVPVLKIKDLAKRMKSSENSSDLVDAVVCRFSGGGSIHIDPSKKGTFTAQATRMGMGVQEAARHIHAHPDNYSPVLRRKAAFALASSKWNKKEDGGLIDRMHEAYGGDVEAMRAVIQEYLKKNA